MSDLKILKTESGQQVVDYEYAKSIIEQQQARIAELEATVGTLHSALRHLAHNAKASGAEMGLALDVASEALESTPQQNLNAVKREAAKRAIVEFGLVTDTRLCDENDLIRLGEEYANETYPDKDGE